MDDATQIAIDNYKQLNNHQRRAFNVRINGEEHYASSRNGTAQIHFPFDGQAMQVSQLMFKLIINDGIRNGGSTDPTDDPTKNWSYGLQTYKTFQDWLNRYPVGSRVDVDNAYSCQCFDYAAAFWAAQTNAFIRTGPLGYAYETWTVSADVNRRGGAFELIYNWKELRPGDWAVFGKVGFGHIAMALSCAFTSTTLVNFRDQNGSQGMKIGDNAYGPVWEDGNRFLGAFRYTNWEIPGCGTIA